MNEGLFNELLFNGLAEEGEEGDIIGEIAEAMALGAQPTAFVVSMLRDRLSTSALFVGSANQNGSLVEALRILDRLRPVLDGLLIESMLAADTSQGRVERIAYLVDALLLAEVVSSRRDAIAALAMVLTVSGRFESANLTEIVEALLIDDELVARLIANGALLEASVLAHDIAAARVVFASVPEALLLSGTANGLASHRTVLEERTGLDFEILIAGEMYQGWAVNTESGAPTEYENFPFNSMCRLGQRYYGAGEGGLFLLDGDNDDGDPIRARILTGEMDFDSPNLKRVERAYMGYTTRGDLALKVIVTHAGKRTEYWYKAAALTSGERTETRVKLGEGMVSRYWQFELVNSGGADFEIDRWDVDVRDLKRRV